MANVASANFSSLTARIEQGQRKALIRTIVLSIATIVVAGLVLVFTLEQIESARTRLATVKDEIAAANAGKVKAEAALAATQTTLKSTEDALEAAQSHASELTQQVNELQGKLDASRKSLADSQNALTASQAALEESKKALAKAFDLNKYVYTLNWGETKMMFVEFGRSAPILEVVTQLKNRVHWGLSNTMDGGFTSPGFAQLVLQQLHKLPANGSLDGLPHDNGAPNVGDIVLYQGGYALFYFRDHTNKEFVVGMTPFGVTALTYDFGTPRTGVIRTGMH